MAQAVQRGCAWTISGSVQGLLGWGLGQPDFVLDLAAGNPVSGRELELDDPQGPSNPSHSVIPTKFHISHWEKTACSWDDMERKLNCYRKYGIWIQCFLWWIATTQRLDCDDSVTEKYNNSLRDSQETLSRYMLPGLVRIPSQSVPPFLNTHFPTCFGCSLSWYFVSNLPLSFSF